MFYRRKAIEPLISVILLIVISVIIVILILTNGTNITNKSLDKTKITEFSSLDAEFFIYPKGIIGKETIQFNYNPPTTLSDEIIIVAYKVLMNDTETEIINLENNYNLKTGQNNLILNNLEEINISNSKINIQLITADNKFILLKNIPLRNENFENTMIQCLNPIFSRDSGEINFNTNITISSTQDVNIYYTIDGEIPDENSTIYNSDITVDENITIKAIAISSYCLDSNVTIVEYTIIPTEQCMTPIFSTESSTLLEDTNITITSQDCDVIYYSIDENTPTRESLIYSSPIIVDENITIKAMAVKDYYIDSNIGTAEYIFNPVIESINLIINGDAEAGNFNGWTTSSQNCSSGWCIGGDPGSRAFYSSYSAGMYMSQTIDLTNNTVQNYSTEYLDSSPSIEINDYISALWGGRYRIYVELRRADNSVITSFDTGTQTRNSADWLRITNTFSSYGVGLRKIYFVHYGQDTRGWLGNYGTAFDNVSIYVN